jgi:Family of unknown function (DUF5681)
MNPNLAEVGKPTRWPPGKSGNPAGKPPGTRTAFSQGVIRDFALVWTEEGLEAVRKVAKKSPEENTTRFAEPDGPANNFGRGAQPFGPGGPMVQFGARQGQLTPFSRSPGSGYNSTPPEPYARPLGNGD